ncbi:MAG: lipoate--protein ligase, partial [Clostridia bacterium]|nr:lipoate--protein ligase [Clostridia bacterium]
LFESLPKDALILYLWQNENTVVIGKNQNPWAECNCELLKSEGGFVARRLSGGGAVFHDLGNLNFTFIASEENLSMEKNFEIIKSACRLCKIEAELSGRNDILVKGKKFSGNAFYHSAGKAYHHGTLLLNTNSEKLARYLTPNAEKLKAKGVKSVKSRTVNLCDIVPELTAEKMQNAIITAAEKEFGLTAEIMDKVEALETKKAADLFGSWDFIFGSSLPFNLTVSKRLTFGICELNLNFEKGKISKARLFTDALDETLSERFEGCLLGCDFSFENIKNRLEKEFERDISNELLKLIEKALMQ